METLQAGLECLKAESGTHLKLESRTSFINNYDGRRKPLQEESQNFKKKKKEVYILKPTACLKYTYYRLYGTAFCVKCLHGEEGVCV